MLCFNICHKNIMQALNPSCKVLLEDKRVSENKYEKKETNDEVEGQRKNKQIQNGEKLEVREAPKTMTLSMARVMRS